VTGIGKTSAGKIRRGAPGTSSARLRLGQVARACAPNQQSAGDAAPAQTAGRGVVEGWAMELLSNPTMCFGCGTENALGLRLQFTWEDGDCLTVLRVKPEFSGWRGYLHGGVLAAALDEVMGNVVWKADLRAMTGKMTIRYRQAVKVGEEVLLRGRMDKVGSRLIRTSAEARRPDGTLVAEAEALYIRVERGSET
jgi:acyl-coenzyme A thioesterase PaaI-like protein